MSFRSRMRRARKGAAALLAGAVALGLVPALALSTAAPKAEAAMQVTQVDNTKLFDEGSYVNQTGNWQDPPFTAASFECKGGRVVRLAPSTEGPENVYTTSNIWPHLVGQTAGVEGWAFIADGTLNPSGTGAEGASVSMYYDEVGMLKDSAAAGEAGVPVDIKVTYTIRKSSLAGATDTYNPGYAFDGHPVLQFTDNFSYGTFQFGITALECTYEFFDSNTHQRLNIGSLFYTKTSMDKGEGFTIDPSLVRGGTGDTGVFVSSGAPNLKGSPLVSPSTRYDAIPNTLLYNGTHAGVDKGVGFSGVPTVKDVGGNYLDYTDTIGDDTYYWRSACVRVDMGRLSSFTATTTAAGWEGWTDGFDIPDPDWWNNGGMMYQTANFLPLTNHKPAAPEKSINGGKDLVTGVRIGDTVRYSVSQEVFKMGSDGLSKYSSFRFADPLPPYVEYVEGSAVVTDPFGQPVPAGAGTASCDGSTLSYVFSPEYLADGMAYTGGDYTLSFDVVVVDQPPDDLLTVDNACDVAINGTSQTTNTVSYEPVKPELGIEKHAVLDYNLATSINEYEYLVHAEHEGCEHDEFGTVHYAGYMHNVTDGTRAKNVTIYDELAPGIELLPDSLKVTWEDGSTEGIATNASPQGWSATLGDLRPWAKVRFEYDCITTAEGNGLEVVNTAQTWATNCELGTPGAEDEHATDDGEVYVNDPDLVLEKDVTESPIQNADYQRGEEYRVGDDLTYSVTIRNDAKGTFAKNVRLTDDDMPAAFELVGDIRVEGLDDNGQGFKVPYPVSGESDAIHGEEETRTIEHSLKRVSNAAKGTWGWNLDINYLPYGMPVTVSWTVRATQPSNGWEVVNQARATADNQPDETFWSNKETVWVNTPELDVDKHVSKTDSAYQVGDVAEYNVELNGLKTPGTLARRTTLQDVVKTAGTAMFDDHSFVVTDQRQHAYNMRERVELYLCEDDKGTVAIDEASGRLVLTDGEGAAVCGPDGAPLYLPDQLAPDAIMAEGERGYEVEADGLDGLSGAILKWGRFASPREVAMEEAEGALMLRWHEGETVRRTDDQSWHVDMAQAYGDETGYWVCDMPFRYVWEDGALTRVDGERNPVGADGNSDLDGSGGYEVVYDKAPHQVTGYSYMKLTYHSTINDMALQNELMVNDATANSLEQRPVTDRAEIAAMGPQLNIAKSSNDGGHFSVGDVADYELSVTNMASGTVAEKVKVSDRFTTAKAGAAEIVDGSVRLFEHHGMTEVPAESFEVSWVDNEAGSHVGFALDTGLDLPSDGEILVRYKVKYLTDNGSDRLVNVADAWADNAPKVTDDHETWSTDAGQSDLVVDKGSNRNEYEGGETGRYTLHVTNKSAEAALNARIHDELAPEARGIAAIVKGSVKVADAEGDAIAAKVTYLSDPSGAIYGFDAETGYDIEPMGAIDVSYDVAFAEVAQDTPAHNGCWASADNTGKAEDDNEVVVRPEDSIPDLPADPGDEGPEGPLGQGGEGGTYGKTGASAGAAGGASGPLMGLLALAALALTGLACARFFGKED